MMWRPISELPESWKDGRPVLMLGDQGYFCATCVQDSIWDNDIWDDGEGGQTLDEAKVTHFAPLLTPENDPVGKLVEAVALVNEMFDIPTLKEAIDELKKVWE